MPRLKSRGNSEAINKVVSPLQWPDDYTIAAIPGKTFPSKYSSNAPPPVDT